MGRLWCENLSPADSRLGRVGKLANSISGNFGTTELSYRVQMVTDAQMRAIALELPEALERSHFGHPDFRVKNRIFATLWPERHRSVLRLTREDQAAALLSDPGVFTIPSGAGRGGWTNVDLSKIDEEQFREWTRKAWTALPRPRPRKEVPRKRS